MPAQWSGNATTKAARAASGGGFESDIEEVVSGTPTISSVADNGDGTLTISGSGFGSKAQAAPRYWEMGSDVRVDGSPMAAISVGVASPDPAVWGSYYPDAGAEDPSNTSGIKVAASSIRHAGINQHWRAWGAGLLASPQFMSALSGDDGREFYFAYRIKAGGRFGFQRVYTASEGLTGSFDISDSRQGGELCDLEDDQGTVIESAKYTINWISPNGVVTISYEPFAQNASTLHGYTLVGKTSGARIKISSTSNYAAPASIKHMRFFQDGLGDPSQFYGSLSSASNGYLTARIYDSAGNISADLDEGVSGVGSPGRDHAGQWVLVEILGALRSNGWIEYRLGGERKYLKTGIQTDKITSQTPMIPSSVGMDTPGVGSISLSDVGIGMDFGEFYMDSSAKRVLLTDSADLSTSTKFEIQRPTAWADSSVTVAKYEGEITGQGYIHVLNGTNYSGGVALQ